MYAGLHLENLLRGEYLWGATIQVNVLAHQLINFKGDKILQRAPPN